MGFLTELFYILCCLGLSGMWGFNIYKGVKNKSKFEIVYCSIITCIFVIMAILKVIENFIS